jgi:rhamnosyl/mannosyltransferase
MKLLQINKLYHPVIGGIESVVKDIAEGLNNSDSFIIDVLACQKRGKRNIEEINKIKVYKAHSFGKALGMPLSFDFFLLFFKIKNNYDKFLIHFPFPLATFLTFFIPKNKLIIFYHSDIVRQRFFKLIFSPFIKYSLNKAGKIIVSGKNIIKSSEMLKKHNAKCEVIPFGVDFLMSNEDKLNAKKIKELNDNKKIILGVGRLVYYKGFTYAISAMKNIDAKLIIIGSGKEKENLENLIKSLNLEEKIEILPPQDNLNPYFLACDIFIFPSCARSEAFGLVQLQALAYGKPIINTYLNTAVEEVSLNNITGLTVNPKNVKEIEIALNKILSNEELYYKFSKNARERFTADKFLENIKKSLL